MLRPWTGEELRRSWMRPRVMSGRSWSMAASMLATTVATSRRAESLLCSTRRSLSRSIVRMVDAPNPMIKTTTISTVIFAVSRSRNAVEPLPPALHANGPARPVGVPEHALDELACAVAREPLVEGDLAGHLVVGHVLPAERAHVVDGERLARPELDCGVHALAPLVVGHAEHGRVLDHRVTVERVLDLGRIDVHATGDDHVALAIADVDEALRVHVGHVADGEPVAADGVPRRLGILVVLVEDARIAAHVELAGLAGRHGPAVVVQDGELDALWRPAARAGLSQQVLGAEDGVESELRRAVALVEHWPEEGDHRVLHQPRAP